MILSIAMGFMLNQAEPAEIAKNIEELNPHISTVRARYLSKIIYKEAQRYDLDPNIITAILRQESNFEPVRTCYIVHRHKSCEITCDYGVSQINSIWLQKWGLDPAELTENDAMNIHVAARVLSIIRRQFGAEDFWMSRYNTSGPKRAEYEASVKDFMAEIE